MTSVVVNDYTIRPAPSYVQPKIPGIQLLSNFRFSGDSEHSIQMWKAFEIGDGIPHAFKDNNHVLSWITLESAIVYQSAEHGFIPITVRFFLYGTGGQICKCNQ